MGQKSHLLCSLATLALVAASPSQAGNTMSHCVVADAGSQPQQAEAMKAYSEAEPPLWTTLGSLSYPITTKSPQAQQYFDQGLKLSFGFNHAEAQRAFRKAQRLDPDCAMCYFGEALVLGPNINVPMAPEANAPALAALSKAQSLGPVLVERPFNCNGSRPIPRVLARGHCACLRPLPSCVVPQIVPQTLVSGLRPTLLSV
jgi:tetratricopeptide (TPR) repeat protein